MKNKYKQNVIKCTFLITEENKNKLDDYCYSHGFDFPKTSSYSDVINSLLSSFFYECGYTSFFSLEKICKNFDERCF